MEFLAGQYVSIDIGGEERRSYSIASAPAMDHAVEICVDVTPGGRGSRYIEGLKPGDEVKLLGPLGQFVSGDAEKEKKLLFVATGSGIAPLRSMILDLLVEKKDEREIWLFWGLRFVKDMFWEEDFRQKHRFFKNFNYELMLSKPPEGWPIISGHVRREIEELGLGSEWGVYLCGNPEMIKEVNQLGSDKQVPQEQIHFEKFF
jgi:NAD(P)H-flavin reductase